MAVLEQERAFYTAHEAEWMAAHPSRFVVVKGERLLGAFDSIEEALEPQVRPPSVPSHFWSAG
jgi:hypothetical protein